MRGYPNANFANGANNRLCHSEHREESRGGKERDSSLTL